ncbi:MSHA pilin protein MshA [Rhodovulum sp. P5]|uniref:VCBS repeat-containing protein n=1 Tax=Rhodovulum sp. P5 TaxID=1564506 RepID=UPI0009C3DE5A|nr:PD40 domain-containing protein [Rhodovulum sp. P5]ARE38882.1 MSHA pilin protein MshA [Rhodovulum sp. P5]
MDEFEAVASALPAVTDATLPTEITRVSVATDGTQSNTGSDNPVLSPDGRFVAFHATANTLVDGDTNGVKDVFVHDRQTGETERVSVASDGSEADSFSYATRISAFSTDGRYVVFDSTATNLVDDGSNELAWDVFIHDRDTGETQQVALSSDGTDADGASYGVAMTPDARFVAFSSEATNLVDDDTNGYTDVFVRDLETGETERVSVASDGSEADLSSSNASLSDDGRYVAFLSSATNLVAGDTNATGEIYVHDRQTGETELVTAAFDDGVSDGDHRNPAISGNGRFVVYNSNASNLVTGDTNEEDDIFVYDRLTGETERVSVASDGAEANNGSAFHRFAGISADGRFVVFDSWATNLVEEDTNGMLDVFVHDRQTGQTARVSVASDGAEGNGSSSDPSISADGQFITFLSYADNFVVGDTNYAEDVFVTANPLYASGADTRQDFNGDGTDDVLWRKETGHVGYWEMQDGDETFHAIGYAGTDWSVQGTGDFNGDDTDDILWRKDTGHVGYFEMDDGQETYHAIGWSGLDWTVDGTGDFNGDGTDDILWRKDTGHVGYFEMNEGQQTYHAIGWSGLDWTVEGTGDFNGDGTDDILWRKDTGHVGYFEMNDGQQTYRAIGWAGLEWSVAGTGDFNGDDTDDILWRKDTGHVGYFEMENGQKTYRAIGWAVTDWSVADVGDFNGDGTDDVLWRKDTGQVGWWEMTDGAATFQVIANVGLEWDVA